MAARQPSTEQRKRCAKVRTDLVSRRQKLIKFADRSEAGWAVVDVYVDDDLADDSEDEKRMERAERMAERKLAKRRKAATQETRGTKRRFQLQFGRQEEVPPPRASQPLPSPIVCNKEASLQSQNCNGPKKESCCYRILQITEFSWSFFSLRKGSIH